MKNEVSIVSDLSCWASAAIYLMGLVVLAVNLKEVQVEDAASYNYASARQSIRRVETDGLRGKIVDRHGRDLATNRKSLSIVLNAAQFQKNSWRATTDEIEKEIERVAKCIGQESPLTRKSIERHVSQTLAMPLVVWRDIGEEELARFSEHDREFPGFKCEETDERVYPYGSVGSHVIGYVGRDRGESEAGDEKFNFHQLEMRGRSGLEIYYDSYLRGVSGERKVLVDARGFAIKDWVVVESKAGPDLKTTLDIDIQKAVEKELEGLVGACVVIDPRDGSVLALASAPSYNPNDFVPILSKELYAKYSKDPKKPLLNRASGGAYAPGSTFKTVTALAGLSIGYPQKRTYECTGVFKLGGLSLHCARRWGHGDMDMRHALRESCNPYFCNLGYEIGTNAIIRAAKTMGLGSKTGIDFGVDVAGVVPDAEWKEAVYHEKWFPGDVTQMAIGQGMLLVSPLQMARIAGAIGTGYLVTPRLKADIPTRKQKLPFAEWQLRVVRDGMEMVVDGGTGKKAKLSSVKVAGKTGTAEIGRGATKRKNTWFIAYAPADDPVIAVAMVIENGDSGGGTTAPKVRNVLASIFGDDNEE